MQSVARTLTVLPCQLAPTQASGAKSGFCTWLLPPRQSGDRVANAVREDVSTPATVEAALSFSAGVPEAAALREARYTAIGSMSPVGISAPRLPAIRRTVVRQPARSFVR